MSGIFHYGNNVYFEVADILTVDTFTDESNQAIYKVFKYLIDNQQYEKLDQVSVLTTLGNLGYNEILQSDLNHIKSIFNRAILQENVKRWAIKIRRLQIARALLTQVRGIGRELEEVTGEEAVQEILGKVENPIFTFSEALLNDSDGPIDFGKQAEDYVKHVSANPVPMVGVDSGMSYMNAHLGGGFRRGCVHLFGARPGVGKTMLCSNFAINIAQQNIPVLIIDTEMQWENILPRILANLTFGDEVRVTINEIETGNFNELATKKQSINNAVKLLKTLSISHINVGDNEFETILSIMRKWIYQEVGFEDNNTKPCLILYDYFHLNNADRLNNSIQEYQLLGYQMYQLSNFSIKYRVPIVCFSQLNRDGIKELHQGILAGADRVVNSLTSMTILRMKSKDELAKEDKEEDGRYKLGNAQLVTLKTRFSDLEGIDNRINVQKFGAYGKIMEI